MIKIINSLKLSTKYFLGTAFGLFTLVLLAIPAVSSASTLYRSLDFGMRGTDVSSLQTFLGTYSDVYPSKLVTGYFGSLTQAGVRGFQISQGIVNSGTPTSTGFGRVGPITMAAINAQMNSGSNTTGYDNSAPVINSLSIILSNNTATLNWNTTENSAAIVYYSTLPISMIEGTPTSPITIGGSSLLVHTDLRSVHSAYLTGLQSNTTYYYVVYVRDGANNENITWPATFRTN
jgi:peptidoglycan hydrolase-like protein with peptidoglycan-binding domain